MKTVIKKDVKREVLSLITDISYSCVPAWYGCTMRNLKMDIITPKVRENHEKCPLVVWFCGGAFRVVDKSVWMPEMMSFARKGYVVASVEYRTSNEAKFPASLIDAKAAIRFLKAHAEEFCIDTDRIAVMGESAGGTMASLVGLTADKKEFDQGDFLEYDSSVNAVIDFYGLIDLNIDLGDEGTDDVPPWMLKDYLGLKYTKEDAEKASALTYVTEQAPPVMILHGGEDVVVSMSQSEAFYEKLQEKGVDTDLLILEGAYHGDDGFYQEDVLSTVDEFLQRAFTKK